MRIDDDLKARRLASEWHSGGGSPLYVLASTGAIVDGVLNEIQESMETTKLPEWMELYFLKEYCRYYGPRGPQEVWGQLTW